LFLLSIYINPESWGLGGNEALIPYPPLFCYGIRPEENESSFCCCLHSGVDLLFIKGWYTKGVENLKSKEEESLNILENACYLTCEVQQLTLGDSVLNVYTRKYMKNDNLFKVLQESGEGDAGGWLAG
jgi:hypothetical protein